MLPEECGLELKRSRHTSRQGRSTPTISSSGGVTDARGQPPRPTRIGRRTCSWLVDVLLVTLIWSAPGLGQTMFCATFNLTGLSEALKVLSKKKNLLDGKNKDWVREKKPASIYDQGSFGYQSAHSHRVNCSSVIIRAMWRAERRVLSTTQGLHDSTPLTLVKEKL